MVTQRDLPVSTAISCMDLLAISAQTRQNKLVNEAQIETTQRSVSVPVAASSALDAILPMVVRPSKEKNDCFRLLAGHAAATLSNSGSGAGEYKGTCRFVEEGQPKQTKCAAELTLAPALTLILTL